MPTTKINVAVDARTKQEVEAVLEELGLNMTSAINMYLKKIVKEQGIPFAVKMQTPSYVASAYDEYEEAKKSSEARKEQSANKGLTEENN